MKFNNLFKPLVINKLTIKNRTVMPSMALYFTDCYDFTDQYQAFYRKRAKGGVGLMFIGPVAIDKVGSTPRILGLFQDCQIEPFKQFNKELHQYTDAKVGIQLTHQGRYASSKETGMIPIAPSAIASPLNREMPREMTKKDIDQVKKNFIKSALRAKDAGFDYIEILAGGGYLIGEFLSPLTNRRTDDYGGSVEKRMRFGLEVIREVRKAIGNDFCMGIRVSGNDYIKGGNTLMESSLFCVEAQKAGVDAINVTGGWHETDIPQISSDVPPGTFLHLARHIKEKVNVPVFASNRLGNPFLANKALGAGMSDMICWGRPLIADPELPNKVMKGHLNETVPCIACNQGCLDAIFSKKQVRCTVNPSAGRELEIQQHSPPKKRIFVAGGGPSGMQFALTATRLGHEVTLYESTNSLGGQVNLIGAIPGKEAYTGVVKSLKNRLETSRVIVKLNTPLNKAILKEEKPDVLVVATGGKPVNLKFPGIDRSNVVSAWDLLEGKVSEIGRDVVIIGGGATGCETALMVSKLNIPSAENFCFLAFHSAYSAGELNKILYSTGRKVTILEMAPQMAANMGASTRWALIKTLKLLSVDLRPKTNIIKIEKNRILIESEKGQEFIPTDTIIVATGSRAYDALAHEVQNLDMDIVTIGDAKKPRKISNAIREGFNTAYKV